VEALVGHFGALEGPNLEKVSCRTQIQYPDPHHSEMQDQDPDPNQSKKQDLDPDPHQRNAYPQQWN
jgi:hypothetical protein